MIVFIFLFSIKDCFFIKLNLKFFNSNIFIMSLSLSCNNISKIAILLILLFNFINNQDKLNINFNFFINNFFINFFNYLFYNFSNLYKP